MANAVKKVGKPSLGTGIYTSTETARLLGVTPRRLRGWAEGYRNVRRDQIRTSAPVLGRENAGAGLLTFHELVELFFVREFIKEGVKLPKVRSVHGLLRQEWNTPFPFAHDKLYTDGKDLLIEAGDGYRDVVRHQQVFTFAELFFRDIDFDRDQVAERWWPIGRDRLIILDPQRAFGAPIDIRSGVRAEVLYNTYQVEGDVKAVADWYEVDEQAVRDAIAFEEKWQKAS